MNRFALIIGINNAAGFPFLKAAVSGAKDFAKWARSQQIEVDLVTDEKEAVTLKRIKTAIKDVVDNQTYNQLIIYFAGHGFLVSADNEIWILSNGFNDGTESINLEGSIDLARDCKIPHVVFISDACRSKPSTNRVLRISGSDIFPLLDYQKHRGEIDTFYATRPGDTAMEIIVEEAKKNYKAIFTTSLLSGLNGAKPDLAVKMDRRGESPIYVITSGNIKEYVIDKVEEVATDYDITLYQYPEIRAESTGHKYLSKISEELVMRGQSSTDEPVDAGSETSGDGGVELEIEDRPRGVATDDRPLGTETDGMGDGAGEDEVEPSIKTRGSTMTYYSSVMSFRNILDEKKIIVKDADPGDSSAPGSVKTLHDEIELISHTKGREGFETRTGFTIVGDRPERAIVTANGRHDLFNDEEGHHVRLYPDPGRSNTLLVQLSNGTGIPLAIIPDFIGTVIVENGRVINVSYIPSRGSHLYDRYEEKADELGYRRAYASVASRNGSFHINDMEASKKMARYLRRLKGLDPSLGLYASYAYHRSGITEEIRSIQRYVSDSGQPVIFDITLLSRQLREATDDQYLQITPFCPILTQGWALLSRVKDLLPPQIVEAKGYLVPGLWTTFNSEWTQYLFNEIEANNLE